MNKDKEDIEQKWDELSEIAKSILEKLGHPITKDKEQSEFGRGFVIHLIKFAEHAYRAYENCDLINYNEIDLIHQIAISLDHKLGLEDAEIGEW